jgi:TolB-like protein/Tfp pilus assembly protein PilF
LHPFRGKTLSETINAILNKAPQAPSSIKPYIPSAMDQVLNKALEKNRGLRFQTASDLRVDLERLRNDGISGRNLSWGRIDAFTVPSIAVLPFADMSPAKDNEWFGDGLSEEIINALTQIPELKVPARTSSFFFRNKDLDIRDIATKLHVGSVLDGSVRMSGNRIRVHAQLINAADGYLLWAERFDREMTDVFAIQDEICRAIVDNLRVNLSIGRPLIKRYTGNVEAYNLCLKGRYHFLKLAPASMAKGKEYFEQAIALDSNYALAWCRLARFYNMMGYFGCMKSNEAHMQAVKAAAKALELDELLPETYAVMGIIRAREFNWTESERQFRRALELDPKAQDCWNNYGFFCLVPMRRLEEAVDASLKAIELDPLSPFLQAELGLRYYLMQKYEQAMDHCKFAIELDPNDFTAHLFLSLNCLGAGKVEEGIEACEQSYRLSGHIPFILAYLGLANAVAERSDEARKILEEMKDLSRSTYVLPSSFGLLYTSLGEVETGFDWLEKAVSEREGHILQLLHQPIMIPLRSHPRYRELLRIMNIAV